MKIKDVKFGMRVVPIRKSVHWDLSLEINPKEALMNSHEWELVKDTTKPYLYVKEIRAELGFVYVFLGGKRSKKGAADFFLPDDFKPYSGDKS